ncbi:MAG: hypothetical protein MHM6MM_000774 [Cercozoa sp. M6MM]
MRTRRRQTGKLLQWTALIATLSLQGFVLQLSYQSLNFSRTHRELNEAIALSGVTVLALLLRGDFTGQPSKPWSFVGDVLLVAVTALTHYRLLLLLPLQNMASLVACNQTFIFHVLLHRASRILYTLIDVTSSVWLLHRAHLKGALMQVDYLALCVITHVCFLQFREFQSRESRLLAHGNNTTNTAAKIRKKNNHNKSATAKSSNLWQLLRQERGQHRVFLGGSCGSTTWRTDIAIPFLQKHGHQYFNPQVESWTPERVEIERHEKNSCDKIFYVVSYETRSFASILEATEFMFTAKDRLTLVLLENADDTPFPDSELRDLKRARTYLRDIAVTNNVTVFASIQEGLGCCCNST